MQPNPSPKASAHTPGPWEFVAKLSASENHKGFFIRAEKATRNGKWALAEVQPADEDGRIGEANARLIAAAPDLLAALVQSHAIQSGTAYGKNARDHTIIRVLEAWMKQAEAAIAKATEHAS